MPDKERIATSPEQDLVFLLDGGTSAYKFVVWVTDVDVEGNVRMAWQHGKETIEDCPDDNWEGVEPGSDREWDTPKQWAKMIRSYPVVKELFTKEYIWEV